MSSSKPATRFSQKDATEGPAGFATTENWKSTDRKSGPNDRTVTGKASALQNCLQNLMVTRHVLGTLPKSYNGRFHPLELVESCGPGSARPWQTKALSL